MINQNSKSVNVSRKHLLEKLEANLETHKADFAEALIGYKIKLADDLQKALWAVEDSTPESVVNVASVSFNPPRSFESEYIEIITMMQMSVDENINLDSSSFKSYVMNQWAWSASFNSSALMYKTIANSR